MLRGDEVGHADQQLPIPFLRGQAGEVIGVGLAPPLAFQLADDVVASCSLAGHLHGVSDAIKTSDLVAEDFSAGFALAGDRQVLGRADFDQLGRLRRNVLGSMRLVEVQFRLGAHG